MRKSVSGGKPSGVALQGRLNEGRGLSFEPASEKYCSTRSASRPVRSASRNSSLKRRRSALQRNMAGHRRQCQSRGAVP